MDIIWIFCAQYMVVLLAAMALVFWVRLQRQRKIYMVVFGLITAVSAYLLAKIGSHLYVDPRPFVDGHVRALIPHGTDNGFPSDHMLFSSVVAVTVCGLSRKWGLILLAGALIVGLGRIMVHVHHPVDILASLGFAATGGIVAWYLTPKLMARIIKDK
jgi:undecaprenyl-diphosphatase